MEFAATAVVVGAGMLAVGSVWNMSVDRDPYLAISGVVGLSGFGICLFGMLSVPLIMIWAR